MSRWRFWKYRNVTFLRHDILGWLRRTALIVLGHLSWVRGGQRSHRRWAGSDQTQNPFSWWWTSRQPHTLSRNEITSSLWRDRWSWNCQNRCWVADKSPQRERSDTVVPVQSPHSIRRLNRPALCCVCEGHGVLRHLCWGSEKPGHTLGRHVPQTLSN